MSALPALRRATFVTFAAAILFWMFFQLSKTPPFDRVNPFAHDPYDAVGSIAFQAALGIGLLSLARIVQLGRNRAPSAARLRLVVRGDGITLLAVAAALVADAAALARDPDRLGLSAWGTVLAGGWALLCVVTLAAALDLLRVSRRLNAAGPGLELPPEMLGEAIEDVFALAWLPVEGLAARWPWLERRVQWAVRWWTHSAAYRWVYEGWFSPRRHPWRCVMAVALAAGALLLAAQFIFEGLPPNLPIAVLLVVIFVGFESLAILGGFALLGGYLGLRPPLVAAKSR